ncbi:LAMI_0D06920g1_1 [Lachancea mirantina]|uniref:LAMI_0D06920g1_1 n=1 Tax=Lachancea mirantina TaxID=1230905 RepID=A0A1G4JCB6_9SACH|nr:LAMI_0D06920g1_1 [Lachancea mirantina]
MTALRKKVDNSWNLINFYKNSGTASKSQVSVDMISENGNFDDVLSNTSSEESNLPLELSRGSRPEFSFDTLKPEPQERGSGFLVEEQAAASAGLATADGEYLEVKQSLAGSARRMTQNLVGNYGRKLRTWHIVVLTSSATLLVSHLVQGFWQNIWNEESQDGLALTPHFTDHGGHSQGAVYRSTEFMVPFGGDVSSSKFYVDFEKRIAYPIDLENSVWSSKYLAFAEYLDDFWHRSKFRSGVQDLKTSLRNGYTSGKDKLQELWDRRSFDIWREDFVPFFWSIVAGPRAQITRFVVPAWQSITLKVSNGSKKLSLEILRASRSVGYEIRHFSDHIFRMPVQAYSHCKDKFNTFAVKFHAQWANTLAMLRRTTQGTKD